MCPPSQGRAGTDGRCLASDGRCHLLSGHASSPLERQQSRRARRAPGLQGGSPAPPGWGGAARLPKNGGAHPSPSGCAEERTLQPLAVLEDAPRALPPALGVSWHRAGFANPKMRVCGRDPAMGSQHPWERDAGAELAQECGEKQGPSRTAGLNTASPEFNALLKPSYLKMMGKQGKTAGF